MINKEALLKNLSKRKTKDYTYVITFLLVFSFFIIFAIRPSINTAMSLRKNIEDMKKADAVYDKEISKVIKLQSQLESIRDDLYLLSDAIPETSKTIDIINNLKDAVANNNLDLINMDMSEVYLKEKASDKKTKKLSINMGIHGDFKSFLSFMKTIGDQRRLKVINSIAIDRDSAVSSGSASIRINLNLEGYYL